MTVDILNPRQFILGGKAEFTLKNTNTDVSYQYRVNKKGNLYFINVRSDSHKLWKYAGFLNENFNFIRGNKGMFQCSSPQIKGILYALKHTEKLNEPMVMYHHGKCACCGKKLTDEESVRLGIGPTCRKYYLRGI